MTVSILQINGRMTVSGEKKDAATGNYTAGPTSAYIEVLYDPPKNIAGKTCFMEASYLNHGPSNMGGYVAGAMHSYIFIANLNSIWSQIYTKSNNPQAQVAIGVLQYTSSLTSATSATYNRAAFTPCGPTIVQIPNGPFRFRITCTRNDGGAISGFTTTSIGTEYFFGSIKFTPIE